jgi:hypothetical protein
MNANMGATKPLLIEITHYLGRLNVQQQKAVLGVVKAFDKEQSWWDDKSYMDAMEQRFEDLENGKVKGITRMNWKLDIYKCIHMAGMHQ